MACCVTLKRRRPRQLQDLCFSVIAKSWNEVLSKSGSRRGIGFLRRKSQELIKKFKETDGDFIQLEHGLFCLNRHLWELNLRFFESRNIPAMLKKLETTEINLTVLSVPMRRKISLDLLWQIVHSLPKTLERLSLMHSSCKNSMLEIIMERCPKLLELNLLSCQKVNDEGIKALCRRDEKGNICQNVVLQKLELRDTRVTKDGLAFLIENFPNLCELNHYHIGEVICNEYREASLDNRLPKQNARTNNLKSLCVGFTQSNVLNSLSTSFTHIKKLEVRIDSQAALSACAEFASLEDVELSIHGPCTLLPFFEKKGLTLKSLSIYNHPESPISPLSVETVVQFCSGLQYLFLWCPKFTEINSFADHSLQCSMPYLTKLSVIDGLHDHLEQSLMFLLSRSPNLQKFTFENHKPFRSSSFLKSLMPCNCMSSLEQLKMDKVDVDVTELKDSMPNFKLC